LERGQKRGIFIILAISKKFQKDLRGIVTQENKIKIYLYQIKSLAQIFKIPAGEALLEYRA